MRLFSEKVQPTFTSSVHNILTVKDYNEIFFDVFEIEINGKKHVVEKISEHNGYPVVSVPVTNNNITETYPFVLNKADTQEIYFNRKTAQATHLNESIDSDNDIEADDCDVLADVINVNLDNDTEADDVDMLADVISEKQNFIIDDIRKAKQTAKQYINELNNIKRKQLQEDNEAEKLRLNEQIEQIKESFVEDFITITNSLKEDIYNQRQEDITSLKENTSSLLNKSLIEITKANKREFETSLTRLQEYIDSVVVETTNTKIENDLQQLNGIFDDIGNAINQNNRTLSEVAKGVEILESADVELNDKITKQTNRALSRIGNVKTELTQLVDASVSKINEFYDTRFAAVEKEIHETNNTLRDEVRSIINESKKSLISELDNLKSQIPDVTIISEKKDTVVDTSKLKKDLEKQISSKFSAEIMTLKKMIELSHGSGSVAVQYRDGGVIYGDLTILGTLSAANFDGGVSGDYLPLSGGQITGDLDVTGSLNTRALYTSSNEFSDYSKSTIYKDIMEAGINTTPTFTLDTEITLSNCKFFITYTSLNKRSVVEAFVMRYNDTCQINVYSIIHSDNINPLITNITCMLSGNRLNVVSDVSNECKAVFNGIATYTDDTIAFSTEDMNYVFETEQGSGILFINE
jgi:hypothetical protein